MFLWADLSLLEDLDVEKVESQSDHSPQQVRGNSEEQHLSKASAAL